TYTINLTGSLPSGTVVANQAVVYFSSVPEETPTNTWVNLVMPLVATPQNLTTAYMTPLTITLSGREVSGLPLTYEVIEPPRGGTLSGTPPNLTYTPVENFTGADGFTFRVSNGITNSRTAQVYLSVTSEGDTTAPQVLWRLPAADAVDVAVSTTPIYTDAIGAAYSPVVLIGVSEALSVSSVTTQTVYFEAVAGSAPPVSVSYDSAFNQIGLILRGPLTPGMEFHITITEGVTDLAGNPMALSTWKFTTKQAITYIYLPIILR
ncbi:MAG: Ig-like domain-containing protein, partial [Chloroflexi bacterium]|nr:Ig-like domain-containing protein [Chloroflexota bacterium]